MPTLWWIVVGGLAMSLLALVGSVTLVLPAEALKRILLPLVAFAAGTLLGGAFLHMLPGALEHGEAVVDAFHWLLAGFSAFFALEQFLWWRHSHRSAAEGRQPVSHLVLMGDAVHNFLGGVAVGGAFVADVRLGISAWIAVAAHEVPQELGDFAVLVHGGWGKARALLFNTLSALTFVVGGLLAHSASALIDVTFLLPFAAGNFVYIAASDLIPEVKKGRGWKGNLVHFMAFVAGIGLLALLRMVLHA